MIHFNLNGYEFEECLDLLTGMDATAKLHLTIDGMSVLIEMIRNSIADPSNIQTQLDSDLVEFLSQIDQCKSVLVLNNNDLLSLRLSANQICLICKVLLEQLNTVVGLCSTDAYSLKMLLAIVEETNPAKREKYIYILQYLLPSLAGIVYHIVASNFDLETEEVI